MDPIIAFVLARIDDLAAEARQPWAPARRTRQVRAYRRIVSRHGKAAGEDCGPCFYDEPEHCPHIKALAYIWADHADYQQEWEI